MSDRDVKFVSHFGGFCGGKLDTKLLFSTTCHPQSMDKLKSLIRL